MPLSIAKRPTLRKTFWHKEGRICLQLLLSAFLLALTSLAVTPDEPPISQADATPQAVVESDKPDSVESNDTLSLLGLFQSGGILMWPILLCSILMTAFAFERAVALRQAAIFPDALLCDLRRLAHNDDLDAAIQLTADHPAAFARLLHPCLLRARDTRGYDLETALEESGARLLYDLRRNCKPLAVIADVSPLLGLMGTVTGMIKAFNVVARTGALGRTELLAAGISEALLTTAFGLLVAIPSVVLYHIYRSKAENMLRLMEDAGLELITTLRTSQPVS